MGADSDKRASSETMAASGCASGSQLRSIVRDPG